MCGICGILNKGRAEPPRTDEIQRMMSSVIHRGPDSAGYYRDRQIALGHVRLAIIDLASGAQPLSNEDGTLWISFNGEIFNYVELRSELESLGHGFRTESDTETIIHAWEEWGEGCFSRFNGQWALALWDVSEKTLVLSRDRLGIRPLYYAEDRGRFLFASEIKALFAAPLSVRRFCLQGLAETFTFWSPAAPRTVFEGVYELPPGCTAVVKNGRLKINPYWQPEFPAADGSMTPDFNEKKEELRDLLISSARLRFERSDVPVGAYLRAGLIRR